MDFTDAADTITAALLGNREFSTATIDAAGSVTLNGPVERDAVIASEHRAGAERIAAGLRMAASRLRPADELVTVKRAELTMWFEGRDGLEVPRCPSGCLTPMEVHSMRDAWVCPSCGAVSLA